MNKENIQLLAQKFLDGTATEEDKIALHTWYDGWQDDEEVVVTASEENMEQVRGKIFEAIKNNVGLQNRKAAKTISIKRQWYMIAAAAVLFIIAGMYFLNVEKQTNPGNKISIATIKDVEAPKGTKAMIQLANGRLVLLDSINSGTLADQGNIKVVKRANGEIVYSGDAMEGSYNTLVNPRGSNVVNVTLQDGSKVWLNSESSIKYPTVFSGKERKIELTGEAYFEVAHNAAMPFKVDVAGKGVVEVLGTHFNVNAYADEPTINTTLLEGSVKFSLPSSAGEGQEVRLSPGQQAKLNEEGKLSVNNNADLDEVMAWKNGVFNFNNANLQTVLRQVSRWYDVDIVFEGAVSERTFDGKMQMDLNLSQVLRLLEKNNVHFRIETGPGGKASKKLIVFK